MRGTAGVVTAGAASVALDPSTDRSADTPADDGGRGGSLAGTAGAPVTAAAPNGVRARDGTPFRFGSADATATPGCGCGDRTGTGSRWSRFLAALTASLAPRSLRSSASDRGTLGRRGGDPAGPGGEVVFATRGRDKAGRPTRESARGLGRRFATGRAPSTGRSSTLLAGGRSNGWPPTTGGGDVTDDT